VVWNFRKKIGKKKTRHPKDQGTEERTEKLSKSGEGGGVGLEVWCEHSEIDWGKELTKAAWGKGNVLEAPRKEWTVGSRTEDGNQTGSKSRRAIIFGKGRGRDEMEFLYRRPLLLHRRLKTLTN